MSLESLSDWLLPAGVAFIVMDYLPPRPNSMWRARLVNTTECKVVGTTEDDLVYFNLINIEAVPDMLSVYSGEFFRMFQPIHRVASTATASLPLLMN